MGAKTEIVPPMRSLATLIVGAAGVLALLEE
jgi:hypothetical protein